MRYVLFLLMLCIASPVFGGQYIVYMGPGIAAPGNSDVQGSSDATTAQMGALWQASDAMAFGIELVHSDVDWSVSTTQLIGVFNIIKDDGEKTWRPYLKLSFGGFQSDIDNQIEGGFLWQIEPSVGMYYDNGGWGWFGSTGANFVFEGNTDQWGAVQTKSGIFFKIGGKQ